MEKENGWIAKCPLCNFKTKSFQFRAHEIVHNKLHEHLWMVHDDIIVEEFRNTYGTFEEAQNARTK